MSDRYAREWYVSSVLLVRTGKMYHSRHVRGFKVAGRAVPDMFGDGTTYYDDSGRVLGTSKPDLVGRGTSYYDPAGTFLGTSMPDLFGDGTTFHTSTGGTAGVARHDLIGDGTSYYDASGRRTGGSRPELFGDGTSVEGSPAFAQSPSEPRAGDAYFSDSHLDYHVGGFSGSRPAPCRDPRPRPKLGSTWPDRAIGLKVFVVTGVLVLVAAVWTLTSGHLRILFNPFVLRILAVVPVVRDRMLVEVAMMLPGWLGATAGFVAAAITLTRAGRRGWIAVCLIAALAAAALSVVVAPALAWLIGLVGY